MESTFWLPPLNSHDDYKTMLSVSQPKEAFTVQEFPEKDFWIKVFVDVVFYSHSNRGWLKGLSIRDTFSVSCHSMIHSPQEDVKKFILNILSYMHIPFELDHIYLAQWHLKSANKKLLKRNCVLPKEKDSFDSWIVKLQEFLHEMVIVDYNEGHNVLPVNLRIKKNVWISSDEFETWLSWFEGKKRVDPNFQDTYIKEISRPRTILELLDAENNYNMKCNKGTTTANIQKASLSALHIDPSYGNESTSTSRAGCTVCLEEFSGLRVCRLPCSHIFHEACITKWLKVGNDMCPLCRFTVMS